MALSINNQQKPVIANNTSPKMQALQKKVNEKIQIKPEEKDNALTVVGGLSILVGLGVALGYRESVIRFCRKSYNNIRKAFQKAEPEADNRIRPHGGPEIDFEKYGNKAIHKSWEKYIGNIEKRIAKHDKMEARYRHIFSENSTRADELEIKAKKEVLSRGDIWK
ncbi:MAG: hypothetical protein NC200_01925 [Candidatus Gastranaerophilales bacterium]|nr:hypothetical protein [Candidatus Gastranaerophilales bacterium]